jgi:hypothetical protein
MRESLLWPENSTPPGVEPRTRNAPNICIVDDSQTSFPWADSARLQPRAPVRSAASSPRPRIELASLVDGQLSRQASGTSAVTPECEGSDRSRAATARFHVASNLAIIGALLGRRTGKSRSQQRAPQERSACYWKSHHLLLHGRQRVPNSTWH